MMGGELLGGQKKSEHIFRNKPQVMTELCESVSVPIHVDLGFLQKYRTHRAYF